MSLSAGAATRDEYWEPYLPPFARRVWPADATLRLMWQRGQFNERVDRATLPPIGVVELRLPGVFTVLPVVGYRLGLDSAAARSRVFAWYQDGAPAGAVVAHGRGRVIATGFMPMLTYGRLASFKPTTLEERWPREPRAVVEMALELAGAEPVVKVSEPVVEASLLTGPAGSAIVLANYTYRPVADLVLEVKLDHPVAAVASAEGGEVAWSRMPGGVRSKLSLESTDVIVLRRLPSSA